MPIVMDADRLSRSLARIAHGLVQLVVGNDLAGGVLGGEPRRGADALDLPARVQLPGAHVRALVHAELQTRRAGIQHENVISHGYFATGAP